MYDDALRDAQRERESDLPGDTASSSGAGVSEAPPDAPRACFDDARGATSVSSRGEHGGAPAVSHGESMRGKQAARPQAPTAGVWTFALGASLQVECLLTSRFPLELEDVTVVLHLQRSARDLWHDFSHEEPGPVHGTAYALSCALVSACKVTGAAATSGESHMEDEEKRDRSEAEARRLDGSTADDKEEMVLTARGVRLKVGLNSITVSGELVEEGDFVLHRIQVQHGSLALIQPLHDHQDYRHCLLRIRSQAAPVVL